MQTDVQTIAIPKVSTFNGMTGLLETPEDGTTALDGLTHRMQQGPPSTPPLLYSGRLHRLYPLNNFYI